MLMSAYIKLLKSTC